ncbi:MAG: TPM domain-containing protein, partial [Bacteriovoracaceae bacterium]|nr:TPM domain-containing protein [Bacteriovoracaceae bacterium]
MLRSLLLILLLSFNTYALDVSKPFSIDSEPEVVEEVEPVVEETQSPSPTEEVSEPAYTDTEKAIPRLSSPVVDTAGLFTRQEQASLAAKIRKIHTSGGPQLQILIVESLEGLAIEEYSIKVAEQWKIGNKQRGDGVIILMSTQDRQVRIEVGEGAEGELTDVDSHQIIQQVMIPNFRSGKFHAGFSQAIDTIAAEFGVEEKAGSSLEALKTKRIASVRHQKEAMASIVLPIIIFFISFPIIIRFIGKNPLLRSVVGSAYLGGLTFFFVGQIFFIVLAVIFGFIIGVVG